MSGTGHGAPEIRPSIPYATTKVSVAWCRLLTANGRNWTGHGILSPPVRLDSTLLPVALQEIPVKLVRVLIAVIAALTAAIAVQLATSSGASATNLPGHVADCTACWGVSTD